MFTKKFRYANIIIEVIKLDLNSLLAEESAKAFKEEELKRIQAVQQEKEEAAKDQKEAEAIVNAYNYFRFLIDNLYEPFVANLIINGHEFLLEDSDPNNKKGANERRPIRGSIEIRNLTPNDFDSFYQRVKDRIGVAGENNNIVNYVEHMSYEIDGRTLTLTFCQNEALVSELTKMIERFISHYDLAVHGPGIRWDLDAQFSDMIKALEAEKELEPQMSANVELLAEEYNIPFENKSR